MRSLLLALLLMLLPAASFAQVPGLTPTTQTADEQAASGDASIDELIEIIENDQTRALLIQRLRGDSVAAEEREVVASDLSIARQLAEYTKAAAEGASTTLQAFGQVFVDLQQGMSGTLDTDMSALRDASVRLAIVGLGLFGTFLVLRLVINRAKDALSRRVAGERLWPRMVAALSALTIDLASVLMAWAAGYGVALFVVGEQAGRMGINQSLLLNAFLFVELTKLVVRTVLAPRLERLRLIGVGDHNAAYWSFWLARIISLVGYTILFVAPLLAANVSRGVADAVQVLVMFTAVVIGIIIVLQNKDEVRLWLTAVAHRHGHGGVWKLLAFLGQVWHLLAIGYLVTLVVVWFANPEDALPFMIGATVQSAVAILIGAVVVSFISRLVGDGFRIPEDVREKLPLLEARLKAFVPTVMEVVRWVVIAGVVIAIAQAWAVIDFAGWIGSAAGRAAAGAVISAAVILLVCGALHIAVSSWIEYRLNENFGKVPTAREKTLLGLFKNAFTIALVVFGLMLALAQIGVNIAPLLAGAGVIGLAIGFGAQKLVQDIITGIFIQFENVMNEGDVVAVGDKSGVVEKLTIRSVTIRDLGGTVHLIPFSSVDQVSNMVRGFSFHVAEIGVAYESDIGQVKQAMLDAFDLLLETEHRENIIDALDMQGVIAFADSAITVRARIKTLPGKHWGVGRAYNEIIKTVFDQRGIEIPYPHVTYVPSTGGSKSDPAMLPTASAAPQAP